VDLQQYEEMKARSIDLWERWEETRSLEIRNKLIVQYSPLVKRIAFKVVGSYQYVNFLEDIVNEGVIALMDAIERFDFSKNVKFETFATIKVKGAMIDFIRKQDCFPRRIKKAARTLADAESLISNALGRAPTQKELANHLDVEIEELEKMQLEVYSLNMYSFEQVVYESNSENILSKFFSNAEDTPEQHLVDKELETKLAKGIMELKENEQIVISLHYKEQLKIKDIAQILKISDSRVSQIHSAALRKLKEIMQEYTRA